jgi:ferritin-like metal-binding protein YciE
LCIDEFRDVYDAKNRLVKALPEMAENADSDELRAGFAEHLEQTTGTLIGFARSLKPWAKNLQAKSVPRCLV